MCLMIHVKVSNRIFMKIIQNQFTCILTQLTVLYVNLFIIWAPGILLPLILKQAFQFLSRIFIVHKAKREVQILYSRGTSHPCLKFISSLQHIISSISKFL